MITFQMCGLIWIRKTRNSFTLLIGCSWYLQRGRIFFSSKNNGWRSPCIAAVYKAAAICRHGRPIFVNLGQLQVGSTSGDCPRFTVQLWTSRDDEFIVCTSYLLTSYSLIRIRCALYLSNFDFSFTK